MTTDVPGGDVPGGDATGGDATGGEVRYFVVRNHEEQYSIWRVDKPVPEGWQVVGSPAAKGECLEKINELWTDMRPLSLRLSMAAAAAGNRIG